MPPEPSGPISGNAVTSLRAAGCASVDEIDEVLGGTLLDGAGSSTAGPAVAGAESTGQGQTGSAVTDRVVVLLSEVRQLARDTVDPRRADARLLGLVPDARREGADLVRDGDALARLATALGAIVAPGAAGAPGAAAGPGATARPADDSAELLDVVAAVEAASVAERAVGGRLAAVDRIDDLVLAAEAVGTIPETAASQRAAVVRWAAGACGPRGSS
jgi:hypothetical protein